MTDHLHDRVVATVGEHYLVEGEIGRGGMAVVYRALDLRLNRRVAIKVLPPELAFNADVRTRFLREAQTSAQLSHPHIVPIHTVDEADGIVYFVMALVDGESLAAVLAREPRRPVEEVRRVLSEVADALEFAHGRGVIHRDIKPDNIIIDRASGRAAVTDFGIARAAAIESRLTATGVAVGTPAYMSPEQALGERELDGRSDIYSLGVVGYQMLAGEPPFRAGNTPALLVKHVSEAPRPVRERRSDAPASLAAAIDRALAKRPEERYASAAEFRAALFAEGPLTASRDGTDRHQPRTAPRARPDGRDSLRAIDDDANHLPHVPAEPVAQQRPAGAQLPFTPIASPPPGLSRRQLRKWRREQQRYAREQWRLQRERLLAGDESAEAWSLERRVRRFRKHLAVTAGVVPALFLIDLATGGEGWSLIPTAVLGADLIFRTASLWADGIGPLAALRTSTLERLRRLRGANAAIAHQVPIAPAEPAASLVPPEVLGGAHGEIVRRAAADRELLRDIVGKLGAVERELIPDVMPTVEALTGRVAALAVTLHRLDADVSGASLGQLDERIMQLQQESTTGDRERRMALLQRQRTSLHDLLERRRTLANQLESASLALENLKLDMLKLRSAGVGSALEDVTSATREARALSRDIAHLLAATDDLRGI